MYTTEKVYEGAEYDLCIGCHGRRSRPPQAVVDGALLALRELENDFVIWLFGDEAQIRACLEGKEYPADRLIVKPSTEVITCEEAPAVAVRRKKNSSMVLAAKAVADKEADCFISAGSTGAVLSCGTLVIRRIKDVQRPALAPLIPNLQGGHTMIIDAGANVDCKPLYLVPAICRSPAALGTRTFGPTGSRTSRRSTLKCPSWRRTT